MKTRILILAVLLLILFAIPIHRFPSAAPEALPDEAPAAEITSPYPVAPPDAEKIWVSPPDEAGFAFVNGNPGAVPGDASVAVVNLTSSSVMTATASPDGSFTAGLFAPPGSQLMVKYDISGILIERFWQDMQLPVLPDFSYINPLPGTMISVIEVPPGDQAVSFQAAGRFGVEQDWSGWWMEGVVTGPPGSNLLHVQRGDTIQVNSEVHITSEAFNCANPAQFNPQAHVHLMYLFDADGNSHPANIWFTSHLFTPTGLPIEKEGSGAEVGVITLDASNQLCTSPHTLTAQLNGSFDVPFNLPDGIYLIRAWMTDPGIPTTPGTPRTKVWYHEGPLAFLPPVTIGAPAAPKIPWTLFGDEPVNGYRGVSAIEDNGQYAMPTRVVTPPHIPVYPLIDARTGQPRAYRMEPGSHWLSGTDRRMSNPLKIPFDFSGSVLAVEVHQPDGSTILLGPAPVVQSSARTPTLPGGTPLAEGTGHIGDLYHVYTGDEAFHFSFEQYGMHTIEISGEMRDVYGNVYPFQGLYQVLIARVLDLDPGQLPTTPYQQGNFFSTWLHVYPPVPAQVHIALTQMPYSDPQNTNVIEAFGAANPFGIFTPPPGSAIELIAPGEFRADILAWYEAPDGTLWAGTMTWGGVIEGPDAAIEAHGRRGMDYHDDTISDMPAWFRVHTLPPEKVGIEVYYPYFNGDVHWGNEDNAPGDSIHSIITLRDLGGINGPIYNLMRANYPRARGGFRWPPDDMSLNGLEKRLAVGEAPLFITTASGIDAAVDPGDIDQFAYSYASSERPDVRVREIISEDNMGTAYWRFNDTYGYQIGESAEGDLPGDLKWEFGGAVFRVPGLGINEYAIYSSFWVLLPHGCDAFGCARVTPPFQDATGASINGGPILTLLGEDIDMLFLPKGVRPGDILEIGQTISFAGHVGPPMDSRVDVAIASPFGAVYTATLRANKVGWVYDPGFDLVANEPGRWTVDVFVEHDRPYVGNGVIPQNHNTGTVLGTAGQYSFYVVEPDAPELVIHTPRPGWLYWPDEGIQPVIIRGFAQPGTQQVHFTVHDKGIDMEQGMLSVAPNGAFSYDYDPVGLNTYFPMLSLTAHEGRWPGLADNVMITFLAEGEPAQAAAVNLIGEQVFVNTIPLAPVFLPLVEH